MRGGPTVRESLGVGGASGGSSAGPRSQLAPLCDAAGFELIGPELADDVESALQTALADGTVFAGSHFGKSLHALSSDGRDLWSLHGDVSSSPAIGPDGTVYVAGDQLYAIRSDGSLNWKAFDPTYEARRNSPVVGHDGTVYFVYHNIPLTALDSADGSVIWSCPLGVNDHCFASPAIGSRPGS
jgi:outer membrane protein assembly factor BamB